MEKAVQLGAIFLGAYWIAFSGALMPGPLLAVTLREAARHGRRAGPLLIVGHALLEAGLVAVLVLGFAAWFARPIVTAVISLLGGAMLLWMGRGMLRTADAAPAPVAGAGVEYSGALIGTGAVASLSNPYWSLWWATTGLGYLVLALPHGLAGILVFFTGHILADFTWYSFVSVSVSRSRRLLAGRAYGGLIRLSGLTLLGFAVWFLTAGARGFSQWLGSR